MNRVFPLTALLLGIIALAACARAVAGEHSAEPGIAAWRQQVQEMVDHPRFRHGVWGVKVISLDTGKTLFEHNAHKFFQPGSNAKLFTAALALDQLGADYRIRTSVSVTARPDEQGVLRGQVIITGRGDPTFNTRWHESGAEAALQPLVSLVAHAGIQTIQGDLIGDESFLHQTAQRTGWMWEDLEHAFGAPLSALSFAANTVQLHLTPATVLGAPARVKDEWADRPLQIVNESTTVEGEPVTVLAARRPLGTDTVVISGQIRQGGEAATLAVPVTFPAQFFLDQLAASLQRQGIRIQGTVRVRSRPEPDAPAESRLGFVESPPLADLVREMLQESDNLTAALLFALAGAQFNPGGGQPPEEWGVAALQRFLVKAGLPAEEVRIEEGTGLSRNSLTTPNAIVALLCSLQDSQCAVPFTEMLPVAGVEGTLQERFAGTFSEGNLRAKTGTLQWAQALSGYVTSRAGERLAFSVILNGYSAAEGSPTATEEVDALAERISGLTARSAAD